MHRNVVYDPNIIWYWDHWLWMILQWLRSQEATEGAGAAILAEGTLEPISFLAGGLEHFLCFHILGIIWNHHPNSLIFFRGVGQPPTSFILGGFENTGGILDDWILNPCFLGWTHLELFHILPENGPRKNRSLRPRMFGNPTIEPNHIVLKVSRNPTSEKSNVIGLPCFRSQSFRLAGMGEQHLI